MNDREARSPPGRGDGPAARATRWCAYALAAVVALGAAGLLGLRVLLPNPELYRTELEAWVSRVMGQPVEIGAIDAGWRGWTPVLRFEDLRLGGDAGGGADPDPDPDADASRTGSAFRLAALAFEIDLVGSLRALSPRLREIAASGASFEVVRRPDGTFVVRDVGAPAREGSGSGAGGPTLQWLWSQPGVMLSSSSILWTDERRGRRALPLTGVTLHLDRRGDGRRVSGSFTPAGSGRVDFALELAGDALPPSWSGAAYVAVTDVDLGAIDLAVLDVRPPWADGLSGVVSGSAWSTWEQARLVEAEGTVRARSPGLTVDGSRRGVDGASASFKVERTPPGWTAVARDLVVTTPNGPWPPSTVAARWTPPRDGRPGTVVANAELVRVEDLVALAAPRPGPPASPVLRTLLGADPHGAIEDLHVSASLADGIEPVDVRARGRFTAMRLALDGGRVSVEGATGRFETGGTGLVTTVDSGVVEVDAPDWLARPLRGTDLAGTLTAIPSPEGVRVRLEDGRLATPAGTIAAHGRVIAPADGGDPEGDVTLALDATRVATLRALVADRALPETVLSWLRAAVPDGDVRGVRLRLDGRLSAAAFDTGDGRLEATVELAVPVFRYAPEWPGVTDLSGVLRFDGPRLDARVTAGRIFGSEVREARITVEDLSVEAPVARVEARVEGTSTDAVRFLAESPLRDQFATAIDAFTVRGDSTIDLVCTVVLESDDPPATVEGTIALDDNRIAVPGVDGEIEAVTGVIAFSDDAVESDGIAANWLGEPMRAVIAPAPAPEDATRLSVEGRLTRRLLAEYFHRSGVVDSPLPEDDALLARLDGDADWSATLDVPHADDAPARLRIVTGLEGVSLDLPPPLGKPRGTRRELTIDARFTLEGERITEFRHAGLASAVLRHVPDGVRDRLDRGTVRFGAGEATLPDAPGVTILGALPELDAGEWRALVDDLAPLGTPDADAPSPGRVREVSIDAGSLTAAGARFPATRVRATLDADRDWRVSLVGPRLEGTVHVPRDPRANPVTADFERLVFETGSADADGPTDADDPTDVDDPTDIGLDPGALPVLSFSARRFVLGDHDLGEVSFITAPSGDGMRLDRLEVRADAFAGDATGRWTLVGGEHRTEFSLRMYGDDFGRVLDSFGFGGNTVAGGTMDVSLDGSWPDAPVAFDSGRLTGVMRFLSKDGRLIQVEPGVTGRVFGLLTVTSLPRRLILDFGDLFRDGFEYDRIEGTFALDRGNAYTDDLFMESDTGRFDVIGRTGIEREDYDKIVTVTPKISSSLPLAPIWLVQKLLNRNVFDRAFAHQYTVTGSWDEPEVEFVTPPDRKTHD